MGLSLGIHAVSKILRHSDISITLRLYGHLVPGYLQDQVNKLRLFDVSAA